MTDEKQFLDFLTTNPETLWMLALIGAVCVIGLVDFCKCWVHRKGIIKWIVFFVSLLVSFIMSPLVPNYITGIVIIWLLILALATIARNSIVDGLPNFINKITGGSSNIKRERGGE